MERDCQDSSDWGEVDISTHTLTWSVTFTIPKREELKNISTHTLTWSVTVRCYQPPPCQVNFNSHAHVERDLGTAFTPVMAGDFNSHAHVERDKIANTPSFVPKISTHTLTWSVTFLRSAEFGALLISTHTLTWSVTC